MIEDNNTVELASNGITGFIDRYRMFTNTKNTKSILVYFTETGACHFFSFPLDELFNQSVSLDVVLNSDTVKAVEEKLQ